MLTILTAAVFVVLWSTGFVVARAITPYADPNLFLFARFGGTALVVAITAGTLFQKTSLAKADIRSASAVQNFGAAVVAAILALALGEHRWIASPQLWASLAWGIVMLSGVSVTLLMWMVRRGEASRATALLFLVPPLAP